MYSNLINMIARRRQAGNPVGIFVLLTLCISQLATAAPNEWTLVKKSVGSEIGRYGTKGTASPDNWPGYRLKCSSWTDANGDLWMFGGFGAGSVYGLFLLNDLWKYNIESGNWTWISGSDLGDDPGVYGTRGVPDSANNPAARESPATWIVGEDLWLFGGLTGLLRNTRNDLWKYNIPSGKWTWIGGSDINNQPGTYGVKGVSDSSNYPSSRWGPTSWKDGDDNLWLFGGYNTSGYLNDLWKYDTDTNIWTWMKGSSDGNSSGTYGIKGVPALDNEPAARQWPASWTDASGRFWMFGGNSYNDLWMYDTASNCWTWMKGSNLTQSPGNFGEKGVPSSDNNPPAMEGAMAASDSWGRLWMVGGHQHYGSYDCIWMYDITSGNWTWMKGSDDLAGGPIYSPDDQQTTATVDIPNPGGRALSGFWSDSESNFWLFGGGSSGNPLVLNDLWYFETPSPNAGVPWESAIRY